MQDLYNPPNPMLLGLRGVYPPAGYDVTGASDASRNDVTKSKKTSKKKKNFWPFSRPNSSETVSPTPPMTWVGFVELS